MAAAPAEPDDATLFRREVGRIQPLRADDHADLAHPRPAPLPRPKTIEPEPEAPRRPVRIDENDPVARGRPPDPGEEAPQGLEAPLHVSDRPGRHRTGVYGGGTDLVSSGPR